MKAGASVRGMESTLEESMLAEALELSVEAANFTSPMACRIGTGRWRLAKHGDLFLPTPRHL